MLEQPDQVAYLIVDEEHMQMPEMPLIRFIDGWETVEEMESALGIPEGNLVASLDRYNENAARGEDPDFHKQPEYVAPQTKGPWAAFDLSLGRAMYSGFTMGGLAVSIDGEVLREDGSVIPGLYAAGACASNIAQDGKGYSSGTQLGEGSFFGRRAGTHAGAVARPDSSRQAPSPSSSSRRSWCCSSVRRWLTLTTMQSGSWCATRGTARTPAPRRARRSTRRGTPPSAPPAAHARTRPAAAHPATASSPSRRPRRAGRPGGRAKPCRGRDRISLSENAAASAG